MTNQGKGGERSSRESRRERSSTTGDRSEDGGGLANALMTTREAARLLRYDSPKTLRKKVAAGVFQEGVHFYKRNGMQYRWIKAGLISYLQGGVSVHGEELRLASGH